MSSKFFKAQLKDQFQAGFTLVELLVVIFILGVLTSLIVSNLQSGRQRARDARRKSEFRELKTALRLYYNDYQHYPAGSGGSILGCGASGTSTCPGTCDADFAAGGTGCETVYMQNLPEDTYQYYSDSSEKFCVQISLENLSDSDLAASHSDCGTICNSLAAGSLADDEYVVCNQ